MALLGYAQREHGSFGATKQALLQLLEVRALKDGDDTLLLVVMQGLIVSSAGIAMADVVVDSVVVEKVRGQPPEVEGALQSLCWGARAVGAIGSAYYSGSLVEEYGPRAVFGYTAFLPLLLIGVSLILKESRGSNSGAKTLPSEKPVSRLP